MNYHVLFSDQLAPSFIEENFLQCLTFDAGNNERHNLLRSNIVACGEQVKHDNGNKGDPYRIGLEQITVSPHDVIDTLSCRAEFKNAYAITVPVDEDLSKVSWEGRDYLTRKGIYHQCNCYLTSNRETREWALAIGEEEKRIQEFGSIKPCIWGSDAHSFERLFEPEEKRYCWIKADPSFQGFLQVLCEPADRVAIQEEKPQCKSPHRVIDSIRFEESDFQKQEIRFNEALTCIIGGRSTGKSMLLRRLAFGIDPAYVKRQEQMSSQRSLDKVKQPLITWADGGSGKRKIIYVPQTYLNKAVDNSEDSSGAGNIISGVVEQDEDIASAREAMNQRIRDVDLKVGESITAYCETQSSIKNVRDKIAEHGSSALFGKTIEDLEKQMDASKGLIALSEDDIDRYFKLTEESKKLDDQAKEFEHDQAFLSGLDQPKVALGQEISYVSSYPVSKETSAELSKLLEKLSSEIAPVWEEGKAHIARDVEERRKKCEARRAEVAEEIESMRKEVEQDNRLKMLAASLTEEKKGLEAALRLEEENRALLAKAKALKQEIIDSRQRYFEASEEFCLFVRGKMESLGTSLELSAEPVFKSRDFIAGLSAALDNRSYSPFSSNFKIDLANVSSEDYEKDLLSNLWWSLENPDEFGGVRLKSGYGFTSVLRTIFQNWYNVHYVVRSGGDDLASMSPGKRGLVFLELIVRLDKGDCPILIDQPEDDLDNRSIYVELARFIRERKRDRQIIIVTHSANVVLGADAEEIIVANQSGVEAKNSEARFEYLTGAIENDVVRQNRNAKASVLKMKSIQEHLCEVLEGGQDALEHRWQKYRLLS